MNPKRILLAALASLSLALPVAAQQPSAAERAAMLKATATRFDHQHLESGPVEHGIPGPIA